jgi:hypothetical protein
MLRDLLRGAFRSSLAAAGLALLLASQLNAQATTGKVQGRVTDAATGAPVAGAQVRVLNSTLGNLTNDQGFYFINEVPAGLQDIEASFIGYRGVVVEGERILAGQTTTINYELEQTAVELEAITVEGERNPLVPRDQMSTKSIVQGQQVDVLPIDNSSDIVLLQPGVIDTENGRTIRGARANEEAVMIDGVITRQFGTGTAQNVDLPTNAIEQVDVNVGAFAAEFGEAQSGVVSFVTRTGGPALTGSLEYQTDQISPDNWRTNFNRGEITLGGPLFGNLSFFLAGTLQGQTRNNTEEAPTRWLQQGFDVLEDDFCSRADVRANLNSDGESFCDLNNLVGGEVATFRSERDGTVAGVNDFVDLAAPNYIQYDNGRVQPFGSFQTDLFTGNLNYQLPRGSRINFSYTRNRTQNFGREQGGLNNFNPDDLRATSNIEQIFTLGWFQTITQSANQQLSLDLRGSYQTDRGQNGVMDAAWWQDHRDPFLGFTFSNVDYALEDLYGPDPTITGFDWFEPSDELINAFRSGAIPLDSMRAYSTREDITRSQSVTGTSGNQRANPFGYRTLYTFQGLDNDGWGQTKEDRLQVRGSFDWQIGRFNRAKFGGEYMSIDLRSNAIGLTEGRPLPEAAQPKRAGFFVQDRLDIGDLVLEGGLRWDWLDPDVDLSRVPSYVFNVPDEWKRDFVRYDPNANGEGVGGYVPLEACDPNDTAECLSNFLETETKSEFSPRLGASFPVTPTSTFRLSWGRFVQTPAFFTNDGFSTGLAGVSNRGIGLLTNSSSDLLGGQNTNTTWARDVDMPSTRKFEFGYRQLIGQDLVIDLSAFNMKQRSSLTTRKLPWEDPNRPGAITYINTMVNKDFTESNGFEVKLDKAFGNIFTTNLSYSFLDARGTGSDPFTYEDLILRATTNLSGLTGLPTIPPEALLLLDQSRKHSIGWSSSLQFPVDWQEGTVTGAIFQNFGVYTLVTLRSGLPFTKLINDGNGQQGPPSLAALQGIPESAINGLETPWNWTFDFKVTKGFALGGLDLQAYVDWRNPLNLTNQTQLFLETASALNELHYEKQLSVALTDSRLDGDNLEDDFWILAESPETDFNKFMLLRAEQRFGNGDGEFTTEEQRAAFGQRYDDIWGETVNFKTSDQNLRLGLRIAF